MKNDIVFNAVESHPKSFTMYVGLFHPILFRFLHWRFEKLNKKTEKRIR